MFTQFGGSMTEAEIAEFVRSTGHGVLSLAKGNVAYGLPVSIAYVEDGDRFILQFVSTPESKKVAFTETSEEATITVYDYQDLLNWRSVIAAGTLHSVPDSEVSDRLAAAFFEQEQGVAGPIRRDPGEGFERTWLEFRINEMTGRYRSEDEETETI